MKYTILFIIFLFSQLHAQNITYEYRINWTEQNSGVNSLLNCISTNPQNYGCLYVCGVNGIVLKTLNNGASWVEVGKNGIPSNIDLNTISNITSNIALVSGNSDSTTYTYRTENGGLNWNLVFTQPNGKINSVFIGYNNFSFLVGNPVGGRWSLWRSSNQGVTWDSAGMYLSQSGNESGFQNSFHYNLMNNNYKLWFGTNNNRIYYSSNSGNNFVVNNIPDQNIYSILSLGNYVFTGGSNLFTSNDNGFNWVIENTLGSGNINGIVFPGIIVITPADNLMNSPTLLIRNDDKIYYTDNGGGGDWEIKYTSSEGNYIHMIGSSNNFWAIKNNGGITNGTIDVITSVEPNNYPYSFELKQNYPNPFNPKTTIPIYVYRSTHITLRIYNSVGELMETLLDEQKNILYYDNIIDYGYPYWVEWDATNYPSGVYYYEVIGDDFKESRKMMLVK